MNGTVFEQTPGQNATPEELALYEPAHQQIQQLDNDKQACKEFIC